MDAAASAVLAAIAGLTGSAIAAVTAPATVKHRNLIGGLHRLANAGCDNTFPFSRIN
jgi:hypothetical protein